MQLSKEQQRNDVSSRNVREQILTVASELFYREGVHAVGVDTIIATAGVAKSSLYRYFRTKDELIAAYLQSEDNAFWEQWDKVVAPYSEPRKKLKALLAWIGTKIAKPGYRGCPQLNIVAEFPDASHPARVIATQHKIELRRRLFELARDLGIAKPELAADQLWLLLDGAFANHELIAANHDPAAFLMKASASIFPNIATRRTR
jgi:AcrR family transcriptional regulator